MSKSGKVYLLIVLFLLLALPISAQDNLDALVNTGGDDDTGAFLVGPDGMTLYMFAADDADCVDSCLQNWPPLSVESDDELSLEDGIPGTLGTYEREDGTLQVTYNDMPLYYFIGDTEPGDTNGDGVNNIWYVVEPVTIYVGRGHAELGNFLVGPDGFTLYLFTPDDSTCIDDCLGVWPPLLAESEDDITISQRLTGETGVFEREDGTLQVTYNDIPLYYFVGDGMIGDANGQDVEGIWYVINTIGTRTSDDYGEYLTGPDGFALYLFTQDDANCVDSCLQNWPPLTVPAQTAIALESGLTGEITFFDRDGVLQVSYEELPLYFFVGDTSPADTNGQGINDVWFLVTRDGEAAGENMD